LKKFCIFTILFVNIVLSKDFSIASPFEGVDGAFLLYDLTNKKVEISYNKELCNVRFSPCSTFKIIHSLIALDSKAVKIEKSKIYWDGKKYPISIWNQDHTLESAIKYSVVWYFQNVARNIGCDFMQKSLYENDFGNCDISSGIDNFWLSSTLKISPMEQLLFLEKLYSNIASFSKRSINLVKNMLILENHPKYVLSGKTGTGFDEKNINIGWFVGHLLKSNKQYVFVCFFKGKKASGKMAKKITKNILCNL
jgi:beta-lactamase class D